jgi:RNA-binding protein YhbY
MHFKVIFFVLLVVVVGGWRFNAGSTVALNTFVQAEPIATTTSPLYFNIQQASTSQLTGRHRRILRSIANREKQRGALPVIQVSFKQRSSELPTISVQPNGAVIAKADLQQTNQCGNHIKSPTFYVNSPEQFATEMCDQLSDIIEKQELIQVKFTHGVTKKQDAKALGLRIAQRIANCELVQVLGHSILLYKKKAFPRLQNKAPYLPTANAVSTSSLLEGRITAMMESEFRRSVEQEDDD